MKWTKYKGNPVLGDKNLGPIFDIAVIYENKTYIMYCSWRKMGGIAVTYSENGINWTTPKLVLNGIPNSTWERRVNRPIVGKLNNTWHMWYTGQNPSSKYSAIGLGLSALMVMV